MVHRAAPQRMNPRPPSGHRGSGFAGPLAAPPSGGGAEGASGGGQFMPSRGGTAASAPKVEGTWVEGACVGSTVLAGAASLATRR